MSYIADKNNQSLDMWQKIKVDIEDKIISGYYEAGSQLPSLRKLTEEYKVGQGSLLKAFSALTFEGVVESKRGVGYFVNAYVRDKLIMERKRTMEKRAKALVEEAKRIDVDLRPIINRLYE